MVRRWDFRFCLLVFPSPVRGVWYGSAFRFSWSEGILPEFFPPFQGVGRWPGFFYPPEISRSAEAGLVQQVLSPAPFPFLPIEAYSTRFLLSDGSMETGIGPGLVHEAVKLQPCVERIYLPPLTYLNVEDRIFYL